MNRLDKFLMLINTLHHFSQISGVTTGTSSSVGCVLTSTDINFVVDIQGANFAQKTWFYNSVATKIAEKIGLTNFTGIGSYLMRVSALGTTGIRLSNVTLADSGNYLLDVVTDSFASGRATTVVSIYSIPNASCIPSCDNSDINPNCEIPEACPVKDSIQAVWTVEGVKYINKFTCTLNSYGKTYSACAEGSAVTTCYSGPALCTQRTCKSTNLLLLLLLLILLLPITIFMILICCGCLDCCQCCRIFGKSKSCVTWYCSAKKCCSFFYCRPGSQRGAFFCGRESEEERCGGCHSCQEKCGCAWPSFCKSKNTKSFGGCSFSCCVEEKIDQGLNETSPAMNGPPAIHTRTQNKVEPKTTKLPPLQGTKQLTLDTNVDLKKHKKEKKKKNKERQDVMKTTEETAKEKRERKSPEGPAAPEEEA